MGGVYTLGVVNIVGREVVLREWFEVWERVMLFRSQCGRRSLHCGCDKLLAGRLF